MEAPHWTPAMSVGEEHLDAQHRALFEAAGKMLTALHEQHSEPALLDTLAFLRRYTLRHFVTEEALLQDSGFPGFLEHRAIHANLTATFLDLEARATRFSVRSESELIKAFIQRVVDHIQGDDAGYVPYLAPSEPVLRPRLESLGRFSMGFPALDEDHASFLAILDQLQDAIREDRGDAELPELVETLQTYARHHFRREELLMDLLDYPDKAAHVAAHAGFMRSLEKLGEQSRTRQPGLAQEALVFLKTWLQEHIGTQDMALVPYLQSLGRI